MPYKVTPQQHAFDVCITEILTRTIRVQATDAREARRKVQDMYNEEEIVLDAGDFMSVEFDVIPIDDEQR